MGEGVGVVGVKPKKPSMGGEGIYLKMYAQFGMHCFLKLVACIEWIAVCIILQTDRFSFQLTILLFEQTGLPRMNGMEYM